jgi:hypothetical protein
MNEISDKALVMINEVANTSVRLDYEYEYGTRKALLDDAKSKYEIARKNLFAYITELENK